jgi:hypothetical protein
VAVIGRYFVIKIPYQVIAIEGAGERVTKDAMAMYTKLAVTVAPQIMCFMNNRKFTFGRHDFGRVLCS